MMERIIYLSSVSGKLIVIRKIKIRKKLPSVELLWAFPFGIVKSLLMKYGVKVRDIRFSRRC